MMKAVIDLGVFDALDEHDGPMELDELGKRLGCTGPLDKLERLCLVCVSMGLLERSTGETGT
jgi:hypothetical protein